jgi:alkanesulfonate monooxygenase SsuD/methylene tetrahydromethanopterin reductase-like flavin-dependent oxidoreductase (luciferase family)
VQFGIFDQNDASGRDPARQYDERLALAELADRLGFDLWQVSEHHGTSLSTAPSPSVFLAALTQRTKRVRLCPLVYLLPLYHPLRLAEEIGMLDRLSGGRFEFGVGRGASAHEVGHFGVPPEEAFARYEEAFAVLMQGLREGRLNHQGKYWSFEDVELSIRPARIPPLWYAVGTPKTVSWPARQGMHIVAGGPAEKIGNIAKAYRAARGEGSPEPLIGALRHVVVAETDSEALDIGRAAWPRFYESFMRLWRRHGGEPRNIRPPAEFDTLIAANIGFAGSPQTVRAKLAELIATTGITYLGASFVFGDMPIAAVRQSLTLFMKEVAPGFA